MLELFVYGNQIASYTGLSSSGNNNGIQVNLTGVQTLGSETDVFRIVVTQVGSGQTSFLNGQSVAIYSWPDNVLIASGLNPQHDQFQGRASSGTHQVFTSQPYAIDLDGFTGTTAQYGPGASPPRGETLPFSALMQEPPVVPCFAVGTRIACPDGWRDVADLRAGDSVMTRDNGPCTLVWTGARRVPGRGPFAPVRFAPGAVGNTRPLLVSPQHRVLLADWRVKLLFGEDEVLVAAKDLVDGVSVTRVELPEITYVHLLLAEHEILDAEGAAAESLHLGPYIVGRLPGTSRAEIVALFPGIAADVRHVPGLARRCLRAWEARFLSDRARAA
jgi:hypothetical protein